jgi:hypothetical protein
MANEVGDESARASAVEFSAPEVNDAAIRTRQYLAVRRAQLGAEAFTLDVLAGDVATAHADHAATVD